MLATAAGPPAPAHGQSYVVHSYTVMEGLTSPATYSLVQDPAGTMWFATRSGIASYDGLRWVLHPDPVVPAARDYTLLVRDERGSLWAVSHRLGRILTRAPGGDWSEFPGPTRALDRFLRVTALAVTYDGSEPVVGLGCGAGGGLYVWRAGAWTHLGAEQGRPAPTVRGIAAWKGELFVATSEGLARVSRSGTITALTPLLPPASRSPTAVVAAEGSSPAGVALWLLGQTSVGVLRDGEFTTVARGFDLGAFAIDSPPILLLDLPHAVYCASAFLMLRVDLTSHAVERLGERNGLLSDGASALLLDRERNLWVAGPRGASKLVSRRFGTYRRAHGLLSDEVSAVGEPSRGRMVFGHNTGLTVLERGTFRRVPFLAGEPDPLAQPRVVDLQADGRGHAWFVAAGRGLGRLGPDSTLTWFPAPPPHAGRESSLLVQGDGSVLVAARDGLFRFDGRQWQVVVPVGRVSTYVRRMARGRDGTLYLATANLGVLAVRNGVPSPLHAPDEPAVRNAFALKTDRQGRLWAGTEAGLFLVQDGALVEPGREALRITEPVFFVTEDGSGGLWFGTDRGVLRWDGSVLRRYTPREGLAGWETNRAAGFTDGRGRVWIGTEGGVSVYEREQDGPAPPPPLVEVTAIEAGDRRLSAREPLELPHDLNSLTFRFRAVSFLDEHAIAVRGFLDGFDDAWSADLPPQTREVRYTNLPPGRYRFWVKAANAAGAWSVAAASVPVTVRRPPWTEWWFRLLASAAAAAALVALVRVAVAWRYARRLEWEVAQRTSALGESESRYRQLFHDPLTPKLLVDPKSGLVVDANDSLTPLATAGGSPVGRPVAEAGIRGLEEAVRRAAAGREVRFVAPLGEGPEGPRELEVRTGPIALGGKLHVLVTAQDVTERRRLEEERIKTSKLDSLSLLAGGLAHDFNNLLMAVLSHVSVARQRARRGLDVDQPLSAAEAALMHASGLTKQLLTFARGGVPVRSLTRLGDLARETAVFALAGSRSSCVFEIPEGLWPAEVDASQFGQLIGNLVLNASQAMSGGGRIRLQASNVDVEEGTPLPLAPGPYVRISIADEGVGIPPDLLDRVFDPYFTTKERGQGLGLASSHTIVRRHEGHIRIESAHGKGTTVTVYLPARPGATVSEEETNRQRVIPDRH